MAILFLSAVFPVAVFLFIIYKKDSEKEPPKLLIKCFMWGCIVTVPIIFIEQFLASFNNFDSAFWNSFYEAFVVAAFVEEGAKFVCLYWIIWKHKEFDQYFDGIVYAVFVSLGFALVENIGYVSMYGFSAAISRAILSVPGHGLFGVIMGYFFALAKFSKYNRKILLWLSFLIPLLFHGLYDFILFYTGKSDNTLFISLMFLGFVALMIVLWRSGIRFIKKHYAADTFQERLSMPFSKNRYVVQPGCYDRMILVKSTREDYLIQTISEFGQQKLSGVVQSHGFLLGRLGDWHIIRVAETVSFFTYHSLVCWLQGYRGKPGMPVYSIGFAHHKTEPALDYIFYIDHNRTEGDSEIGVFRNGKSFYIFLPESNEAFGNLTMTNYFKLSWFETIDFLSRNGLDISKIDSAGYVEYFIGMKE